MIAMQNRTAAYDRGNGVFKNELFLTIVLKQNGILVERPDLSSQLYTAHQVNRYRRLVFANRIQKGVLNILCRLVIHVPISIYLGTLWGLPVFLMSSKMLFIH